MITKQVRKVKIVDEEIRQINESWTTLTVMPLLGISQIYMLLRPTPQAPIQISQYLRRTLNVPFCLEDMKPPIKIFQCLNGHVMCDTCKSHPEVITCPTCRVPLVGVNSLMRNLPMEKLARSYYNKLDGSPALVRKRLRDNDPYNSLNIVRSRIRKSND
ncbi:SIAH1 [Lepeophtheirus salmonis]|uniref:SIAH1 n=1 Tax=Lepeophtheirus salmonis TaxID=72036 RepID=A0A7R8CJ64_LEPSM|nr:SIAH1 [Lepeophtheirus salmonis]CAF2807988.1 SIAH1 [Lepeophtheirus salmonis]